MASVAPVARPLAARPVVQATSSRAHHVICMANSKVMQAEVEVRPGEPFDAAMRRFRRKVTNAGVINEVKRRRTFENSQDIKKRKEKERHLKNKRRGYVPTLDDAAPLVQAPPFSDMFGFDGASVLNTSRSSPSKVQQAVTVSAADVGKILGFRGATQQAMEARTGAHIFVQRVEGTETDQIVVEGDEESVRKGLELVQGVLEKGAEAFELPTGRNAGGRKGPVAKEAVEA